MQNAFVDLNGIFSIFEKLHIHSSSNDDYMHNCSKTFDLYKENLNVCTFAYVHLIS